MQNIYYTHAITKAQLASLKRRTRHIIKQTDNDTGVSQLYVNSYRRDVCTYLGQKAYNYLERHLDARDGAWRVSSEYSWDALERKGMHSIPNKKPVKE
jgi:hypothetical protein